MTDPVERLNEWRSAVFLLALAIVWIPIFLWEMIGRKGVDYGVDSMLTAAIPVIIAGRILISRAKGTE